MHRPKPLPEIGLMVSSDDAEAQFYEALQRGDIDKLMAVWHDDDDICCVHPNGPRVVGPNAIRTTFEAMFGNGPIDARPERVRRLFLHDVAVHSVVERIQALTDEGPQVGWVLATNVYVKTALGWRLVTHHASPGTGDELPEVGELPAVLH